MLDSELKLVRDYHRQRVESEGAPVDLAASKRRERQRWHQIMARCYKEAHHAYPRYGGRGIRVYPAWHDFDAFLHDVGHCPGQGLSLDRIDNDGDYEPGNVRWATRSEQAANTGRRAVNVSVLKVGKNWRALVRVSKAQSFKTKTEALEWGEQLLARLLKDAA